ncbi:MAG: prepilin peptidase [Rhizobiaceae bacterium]|nr:prepilin peptidase [Rhizobiaceae bacterium]
MLVAAILVVFPFCMVFSAVSDTLSMTIANRVPLVLLGAFVVIAPLTGMEWTAFGWHLLAGALALTLTFGMFALGAMGGGDAKLIAATALWMGFGMPLMQYAVFSAFFGGVLTMAILAYRASPLSAYTGHNIFLRNFTQGTKGVPYGIALGIAGIAVYPRSPLMLWAIDRLAGG